MADAEVAALATAFRTAAPSPEIAATAMKRFTSTLVAGETMTRRQAEVMQRLGLDASDLARRMRTDARGAIIDVMEALQQLPEHEQTSQLRLLFGDEAVGAIAPLLGNLDNLRRAFELVGDETGYAGAMSEEYQGVADTTAAKLIVFQNHLKRVSVALTPLLGLLQELLAAVQPILEQLTAWMQANPDLLRSIAMVMAGLYGFRVASLAVRLAIQPLIALFWIFNGLLGAGAWLAGAALSVMAKLGTVFLWLGKAVFGAGAAIRWLGWA